MFSEIEVTCPESGETYVVNVKNPAEEWICPCCGKIHEEHCYTLFIDGLMLKTTEPINYC